MNKINRLHLSLLFISLTQIYCNFTQKQADKYCNDGEFQITPESYSDYSTVKSFYNGKFILDLDFDVENDTSKFYIDLLTTGNIKKDIGVFLKVIWLYLIFLCIGILVIISKF